MMSIGDRQYRLAQNSKVIVYDAYKSNLGNVYIKIKVIEIDNNCNTSTIQEWTLHSGKAITMPIEKLPDNIRIALTRNKDKLPLLEYVYW